VQDQSLSPFSPPKNRAVFKVSSVNFGFKSMDDKMMLIENFGKFLNSLNFPVQILCDSKTVNPDEWLLKIHDEEYYQFLKDTINSKNVTEKTFYIAFTASDEVELGMLKNNIRNHVKRCNLICEEIVPHEPQAIPQLSVNHVKVGEWYHSTFIVKNWPHSGSAGWLEDLYNLDKNISLSMFIHPVPKDEAVKYIGRQLAKLGSSVVIKEQESCHDGLEDEDIVTAINMRDELNKNEGRFVFVSYYITVKAKSVTELKKDIKYVKTILSGMMIETKQATLRQDDAFRCSLPHGVDYLKNKAMYTFTTTPLKRFFPFISANIVDKGGILIGENLLNSSLIFLDHFSYQTASMLVIGKAGSGKSYAVKAQIEKLIRQGIEVTVLDIEDEFSRMHPHRNLIIKHYGKTPNEEYKKFLFKYWEKVNADSSIPRFLVIDEFWWHMKDPEIAQLLQMIVKLSRKRWLGLCVITQEVYDMLRNEFAESIVNNCSIKILLKIEPNQRESVQKTFGLTNSEVSFLIGAIEGEGILFAGSNHVQFKTITSPEQHKRITTKPQELHLAI
jgi:hypothetical protein